MDLTDQDNINKLFTERNGIKNSKNESIGEDTLTLLEDKLASFISGDLHHALQHGRNYGRRSTDIK